MEDSEARDRFHKIELDVANHTTQIIALNKKAGDQQKTIEKSAEKMDKLFTRLTIIAAFIAGVGFVSSETGGSLLRTLLGLLV